MSSTPLFVTSNAGKVLEVSAILGVPVEQLDLDLPEVQSLDVEVVARDKATRAWQHAGRTVFVEDTGLMIEGIGGLPGALVRWFLGTIGPRGICDLIPAGVSRAATARTAVAWCDGDSVDLFVGETSGVILERPAGTGGFGWDAVFRPDGATRTFAEMDQAERNRYSMRRRAIEQMRVRMFPS